MEPLSYAESMEWASGRSSSHRERLGKILTWNACNVERLIGSIRRECLDRVIVFNQGQLRRVLESYLEYYHKIRPHRSLSHDSPMHRPVEAPDDGKVIEMPMVGGLHHQYRRQAA